MHCRRRILLRRGLEFHVYTINKSAHTKKSLETYLMIFVYQPLYVIQCQFLFIHIYWIYKIWLGWVLWHINHYRLFNTKSSLYIYIKYLWFCLVGFYGISTIVGYLLPNPLYTYILNIYDFVWLGFMVYQPL